MFEIVSVCTGNICRSPLAEQLLRTRLNLPAGRISSAGTRAPEGAGMTPEARRMAERLGVDPALPAAHAARRLTEAHVADADLVLAMARDHRRRAVELAPTRIRSTFTVREFARLAGSASDVELMEAARGGGADPSDRLRAAVAAVASRRGVVPAPVDPQDDDVLDPYGLPFAAYKRSAAQLTPTLDQVVRVVRLATASRA